MLFDDLAPDIERQKGMGYMSITLQDPIDSNLGTISVSISPVQSSEIDDEEGEYL